MSKKYLIWNVFFRNVKNQPFEVVFIDLYFRSTFQSKYIFKALPYQSNPYISISFDGKYFFSLTFKYSYLFFDSKWLTSTFVKSKLLKKRLIPQIVNIFLAAELLHQVKIYSPHPIPGENWTKDELIFDISSLLLFCSF